MFELKCEDLIEPGKLEAVLDAVLARSSRRSHLHGEEHWRRVAANGLALASYTASGDPELIFLFGLLHDSQRHNDGLDPKHGARAADLARELQEETLRISQRRLDALVRACEGHADGKTSRDPTVGICWDADRLDLWRTGVPPRARFLSTPAARSKEWIQRARRTQALEWDDLIGLTTEQVAEQNTPRISLPGRPPMDPRYYTLLGEQGFLGAPQVVSSAELDEFIAAGELELWRNVDSEEHTQELMYAKRPFIGADGICCYPAPYHKGAVLLNGPNRKILRMCLKLGVRIVDFTQVNQRAGQRRVSWPSPETMGSVVSQGIEVIGLYREVRVMNRAALRIQSTTLDPGRLFSEAVVIS